MFDRRTPERTVLVGDVAIAFLHIAQTGAEPMVLAVIASSVQRGCLQPHVSTSGDVGTRRQHAAYFTAQNAINIGNALRAAVSFFERGRQLAAVQALADG